MKKRNKLAGLMVALALVSFLAKSPSPTWATPEVCSAALCITVEDCWENCPDADSAYCVNNGCQYNLGPGGPGGSACPEARLCLDASYCDYGTVQGNCVNNGCVC